MKKILTLIAALIALAALCACTKQKPVTPPPPPVVTPQPPPSEVETPEPQLACVTDKVLKDENGKELVLIHISLPNESGSPAFEQITSFYNGWLDDTLFYAENTLLQSAKSACAKPDFEPYTLVSDFSVCRRDDAVYSVERQMTVSSGDVLKNPHSVLLQSDLFETFSMENGGRLSIFDLWNNDADWQNTLWAEMCATAPQLANIPPDFDAFPFDFSLTQESIHIFRTITLPDETDPSSTCFDIPYEKIKPLMQEKWIYVNDK